MAQQLRTKLGSNLKDDETMNEITQVLSSIGFINPVTKEVAGSDYNKLLLDQIVDYFTEYFKTSTDKMITLIDAYCIYNRARGVSKWRIL